MRLYRLRFIQDLSISLAEAWTFFSDPRNLPVLTPSFLHLRITSELPEKMYPGMIITYRVSPFLGIPITWVTEITHIIEPYVFVDEQRFGPYRFWHHTHQLCEIEGGVQVHDLVYYALPLGPLAPLVNGLLVERRLRRIFEYRRQVLERLFVACEPLHRDQD